LRFWVRWAYDHSTFDGRWEWECGVWSLGERERGKGARSQFIVLGLRVITCYTIWPCGHVQGTKLTSS
jgi:hypothetical protein